ncbi:MAG: beta-N-acetylhexosaminidase [Phycisphaerae bacterium]
MNPLLLVPAPKSITPRPGRYTLPPRLFIALEDLPATRDIFAAERFILEAEPLTGTAMQIAIVPPGSPPMAQPSEELRVRFNNQIEHDQAYTLQISPNGIEITACTAPGTFYAFQTLIQIIRQHAQPSPAAGGGNRKSKIQNRKSAIKLPVLSIEDAPDFPRRGFYHDCSRGKVPTIDTLLQLIDDLGHLKYNEFQLYIENVFEFRKHPEMYDDTTPFTADEILLLDSACKARHIDFVPSLTSLGHFEKILSRPAFRHLAEVEPEDLKKAGIKTWSEQPWTLCTTDPAAKQFLKDMYDEFVPNFSSPTFNICCDESWDLGKGRSKSELDRIGPGQMYVNWVNYCNDLAKSLGKKIQMWGDIILNHPELIPQLPPDATLLEWGYESHHKFDEHCKTFAERIAQSPPSPTARANGLSSAEGSLATTPPSQKSKIENQKSKIFYVAPGTASWLSLASRSRNALGNIHNAARAGLKHGASGLLLTDWGDNGHQQLLAVSLLPLAYSAAAAWNLASVPDPSIPEPPNWETGIVPPGTKSLDRPLQPFLQATSLHLFQDPSKTTASLAYDLGLTYERFSWQRFNGSLEWFLFREKWDFANYVNRADPKDLPKLINTTQQLTTQFRNARFDHPDAQIIKDEFLLTCAQIIHTCKRTILRQHWLAADPATRNPEAPAYGTRSVSAGPSPARTTGSTSAQAAKEYPKPIPLPKNFKSQLKQLEKEAATLEKQYTALWLARNKQSRLADITAEFRRLQSEYKRIASTTQP